MSTRYSQFSSLTLEQVDELFRKYDKNGDGIITKEELTGFFSQLDCPNNSTQSNTHGSKPLPSKPLPPKIKTNSHDPHAYAPNVMSKARQLPNEKVEVKAKASESVTNTHKLAKDTKSKHGAKANEHPLNKLPAKMFEDKAHNNKVPAIRDLTKKGSSIIRLNREHMKDIFREHDLDGDGFLDYGELTMAFGFLGSALSCYEARNGIARADANGDGLISEEELDKLIDYAEELYGDDLVF